MKKKIPFWEKTCYCLIILKKDGDCSRIYYDTYDDMSWNAVYVEYSPNCAKARGMVFDECVNKWKTAFRIG